MIATMGISLIIYILSSLSKVKSMGYNPVEMVKISNGVFTITIVCQLLAIVVLLPISMATSITIEKERNSLELLLLTKMKPWTIIIQKYLGKLIPIFMFLFLSLPMIAVAYSFGGFDFDAVKYIIIELFFVISYIGALSIMWSSFCRTSYGAVILSYLSLAITCFLFWLMLPAYWYYYNDYSLLNSYYIKWFWGQAISTLFFLSLSLFFLKRRIHPKSRDVFLLLLRKIDQFWNAINNRFGGVEFARSANYKLPEMNPIQWYEKYKRATGRFHYLFRIVLLLSIIPLGTAIFCCIAPRAYYIGEYFSMALLLFISIFLVLKASALIANDRLNQTLDVLLTTSLNPKYIVKAKMKTLLKVRYAISFPVLLALFMIHFFRMTSGNSYGNNPHIFYLLLIYVFVHLSFISWFSCWVGLKVKKYYQAILIIFITFAIWFFIPLITVFLQLHDRRNLFSRISYGHIHLKDMIPFISPVSILFSPYANLLYLLLYIPGILYIWFWARRFKTSLESLIVFGISLILWFTIPMLPISNYANIDYAIRSDNILDILSYISPLTPLFIDRWNFSYFPVVLSSIVVFLLYLHFRFLSIVNADNYLRE